MKTVFTKEDVGCFADCANGEEHRRQRIAELLTVVTKNVKPMEPLRKIQISQVYASLQDEPLDDYSDENDAIDILNDYTEEGYTWEMVDGDLLLINIDEP